MPLPWTMDMWKERVGIKRRHALSMVWTLMGLVNSSVNLDLHFITWAWFNPKMNPSYECSQSKVIFQVWSSIRSEKRSKWSGSMRMETSLAFSSCSSVVRGLLQTCLVYTTHSFPAVHDCQLCVSDEVIQATARENAKGCAAGQGNTEISFIILGMAIHNRKSL